MCEKRNSVIGHIKGRSVRLDSCIRSVIEALNRAGQTTVASCCGHGIYPRTILCRDGFERVYDMDTKVTIPRLRRFYRRDSKGFYYVPERLEKK